MRKLYFNVEGQKLSKNGDFSNIIRGTKGYLECNFNFIGDDWKGYKLIAVFESKNVEYAIPIKSRACTVPDEVTDSSNFILKIIGVKDKQKILTNRVLVSQEG